MPPLKIIATLQHSIDTGVELWSVPGTNPPLFNHDHFILYIWGAIQRLPEPERQETLRFILSLPKYQANSVLFTRDDIACALVIVGVAQSCKENFKAAELRERLAQLGSNQVSEPEIVEFEDVGIPWADDMFIKYSFGLVEDVNDSVVIKQRAYIVMAELAGRAPALFSRAVSQFNNVWAIVDPLNQGVLDRDGLYILLYFLALANNVNNILPPSLPLGIRNAILMERERVLAGTASTANLFTSPAKVESLSNTPSPIILTPTRIGLTSTTPQKGTNPFRSPQEGNDSSRHRTNSFASNSSSMSVNLPQPQTPTPNHGGQVARPLILAAAPQLPSNQVIQGTQHSQNPNEAAISVGVPPQISVASGPQDMISSQHNPSQSAIPSQNTRSSQQQSASAPPTAPEIPGQAGGPGVSVHAQPVTPPLSAPAFQTPVSQNIPTNQPSVNPSFSAAGRNTSMLGISEANNTQAPTQLPSGMSLEELARAISGRIIELTAAEILNIGQCPRRSDIAHSHPVQH
ncbi:hypothetical protein M422DRAFT_243816 [Sphaerobolus stellatus SS14]|nr:hypothetical protein M422DRAFT_243816 [Sphaerobolus stellatus SS14]